jgi:hypothetical protein
VVYSPPVGNAINFNLIDSYSVPTGNMINFNLVVGATGIKQLVIKSTATPGYIINSINVEKLEGNDVLYVNTVSGIVRVFSSTCTGIIDNRNIIDSDYASGNCAAEIIWAGTDNKAIELNTASGTYDEFVLSGTVSCLLYYRF